MDFPQHRIVITGANGKLGLALLTTLAAHAHAHVRALVRSERARKTIEDAGLRPLPEVEIVDYTSPRQLEEGLRGAKYVIHLVGIIKQTSDSDYVEAHEQTCHALALAASRAGIDRIVYLSIVGAAPDSDNTCLASKGRGERLLLDDRVPATILRVPMVIGGNDPASDALRRQARAPSIRLINAGRTLQQPIDARDVVTAILSACTAEPGRALSIDAAGPECLSHRELVLRAARLWQNQPKIRSMPLAFARLGVRFLDRFLSNPPITPAMFEILQHDDRVDQNRFSEILDLTLTPLDTTLSDHIGPGSETSR